MFPLAILWIAELWPQARETPSARSDLLSIDIPSFRLLLDAHYPIPLPLLQLPSSATAASTSPDRLRRVAAEKLRSPIGFSQPIRTPSVRRLRRYSAAQPAGAVLVVAAVAPTFPPPKISPIDQRRPLPPPAPSRLERDSQVRYFNRALLILPARRVGSPSRVPCRPPPPSAAAVYPDSSPRTARDETTSCRARSLAPSVLPLCSVFIYSHPLVIHFVDA